MIFCPLYSGSSGNSVFIGTKNTKILVDAGLPGKRIDEAIVSIGQNPRDLNGIFITHEHSDHIKGVGIISRKYDIPIYANDATWCAMESSLGKIKEHNIKVMDKRTIVEVNDMQIKSFCIPHDAAGPYPYPLKRRVLSEIGHLSNDDCGKAIVTLINHGILRNLYLGHLSNTNNHPDLAYQTVLNILNENNIYIGKDVAISLAERHKPSNYIEF